MREKTTPTRISKELHSYINIFSGDNCIRPNILRDRLLEKGLASLVLALDKRDGNPHNVAYTEDMSDRQVLRAAYKARIISNDMPDANETLKGLGL